MVAIESGVKITSKVPSDLRKASSFEQYVIKLKAWSLIMEIAEEKQGILVVLELPERDEHDSDIKNKVFATIKVEDLNKEDGLRTVIDFMNQEVGQEDFTEVLDTFDQFAKFEIVLERHKTISGFISDYDSLRSKMEAKGTKLPPEVLAFKLIRKAGCDQRETIVIMSELNLSDKVTIYKRAK